MQNKKYSLPSNVLYSLKANWNDSPSAILWAVVGVAARTSVPFVGILMPKLVIDALTRNAAPQEFLLSVGGAAAVLVALSFLQGYSGHIIDSEFGMLGSSRTAIAGAMKIIDMDYEQLSDPDAKLKQEKAGKMSQSNHSAGNVMPMSLTNLLVQFCGFLLYGSVIFTVHWALLPLLALSAVVSSLMLRRAAKYEESKREEIAKTEEKLEYIASAFTNTEMAKDLRLYSMLDWFKDNKTALFKQNREENSGIAARKFQSSLSGAAMILLRDGAAYALLVYLLINNRVTLGEFTLMFAAIGAFAGWIQGIITQSGKVYQGSVQIRDFRTFIDMPDRMNRGAGAPLPNREFEITLENVSYTYPKAEVPALENINLTIKPGERLAVVGINGAGKSTLVKLICGLYRPTTGTIKLNGVDISEFNRDEYYTLFSAVFQGIYEMSTTIACNISQLPEAETDRERVEKCLELSGLSEKINSLPKGVDTLLLKELELEATEFSGGEKQKLALARALYKNAPVIILDEPTAALDPIAEDETYRRYAELSEGKTSVYISHRLASTRFCDRIIMLNNRTISETGTHAELLKNNSKYAEMFNVQASYYRTEVSKNGE
jgi:ATP-binding cassette subfamily B protein